MQGFFFLGHIAQRYHVYLLLLCSYTMCVCVFSGADPCARVSPHSQPGTAGNPTDRRGAGADRSKDRPHPASSQRCLWSRQWRHWEEDSRVSDDTVYVFLFFRIKLLKCFFDLDQKTWKHMFLVKRLKLSWNVSCLGLWWCLFKCLNALGLDNA